MAHPYHEHRAEHVAKANKILHRAGHKGFAHGGHVDADEDAGMVKSGVRQHENDLHGGKHSKLHLKDGGHVEGERGHHHMAHRARGGKTHGGKHTKVNVIIAPQGGGGGGAPPMAARPPMAAAPPPRPPMPPPGGAPMGGPPPMPPPGMTRPGMGMPGAMPPGGMMRARGGKVHMEAGSGSGPGRLEKMHDYGKGGFKPKERCKA